MTSQTPISLKWFFRCFHQVLTYCTHATPIYSELLSSKISNSDFTNSLPDIVSRELFCLNILLFEILHFESSLCQSNQPEFLNFSPWTTWSCIPNLKFPYDYQAAPLLDCNNQLLLLLYFPPSLLSFLVIFCLCEVKYHWILKTNLWPELPRR